MRPDELRVPPLGLVLALGRPDLHEECARVLRNLKPPLGLTTRDDIADAPDALKARARKRSVKVSLRERVGPGGGASQGICRMVSLPAAMSHGGPRSRLICVQRG